jgi:hypothetical protein
MIEIALGIWFTCFTLSMTVVSINFFLTRRQLQSPQLKTLNLNLQKIGLFWSNTNADFSAIAEDAIEKDAKKTLRNSLLIGFLGLASIPGFLLLTAVVISVRFLARSRKEVATFRSALTSDAALEKSDVENLVNELRLIH